MKALVLFVVAVCFGGAALGQSPVREHDLSRFAGKWLFDVKKSSKGLEHVYGGQILEIRFTGPELTILKTQSLKGQTRSATLRLFTDGRGEQNQPFPFNPTFRVVSKTKWEKLSLVWEYEIPFNTADKSAGGTASRERQYFAVSDDGNVLTVRVESEIDLSAGSMGQEVKGHSSEKRVYIRQP